VFLLREEPTREGPLTSPPREGRPIAIFVVASILGHVALVAAAPAVVGPMLADAPADDLVFIDLPPEPEPEAVVQPLPEPEEPEVVPEPEPEPAVEPEPAPAPEPVPELPPVEEPAEPDDPPSEEPPSEEPPAAQAEVAQAGTGVAETVASAAGGLAVDRLAGAGNAGRRDGAARTAPAPARPDPNALRAWRLSAMRALGRPEATLALRRTGLEGTAVVAFRIDAAGHVVGVRLFRSSGHDLVDQAALEYARRHRDFPAPPAPWETREVRLPLRYAANG